MQTGKIEITVLDEDDTLQFMLELDNSVCKTSIDFYGYADCFKKFGQSLSSFPINMESDAAAVLEIGDRGKFAYYIFLKAYCYEANGNAAIQVSIDNNAIAPYCCKSDFFIITNIASINDLGMQLLNWDPKKQKKLIWEANKN